MALTDCRSRHRFDRGGGWCLCHPSFALSASVGLEKEELVQALGLSFTVSTVALMLNFVLVGALNAAIAGSVVGAL